MAQVAVAEVMHTKGDLFRHRRGRGNPKGSRTSSDTQIEDLDAPDVADDDPMSVGAHRKGRSARGLRQHQRSITEDAAC